MACPAPLRGASRPAHRRHEASILVTGAAVQWLRDGLGVIEFAADTEPLAASLDSNDGSTSCPR